MASSDSQAPEPRLLTAELSDAVGRECSYEAPEELGRAAIRYFALAIGAVNPIYFDARAARGEGYDDVVAPPTLVCETNQYMTGEPDEDGYLGHGWGLDVPNTRLIRAGNEYEFFRPVYPADRISAHWRIEDITEKTSRAGAALLFVVSVATYSNQNGDVLARNRETVIYQELGS